MNVTARVLSILVFSGWAASTNATLIGDSVNASIISLNSGGSIGTQFSSPAVVGAGTEFTGNWLFPPFGQNWQVDLDIGASSFEVTIENILTTGNISSSAGILAISITDLDWTPATSIQQVTASSITVGVSAISFTADTIRVDWGLFPNGSTSNTYAFDITTQQQNSVPTPATLALFGLGLAGLGWSRRKKA